MLVAYMRGNGTGNIFCQESGLNGSNGEGLSVITQNLVLGRKDGRSSLFGTYLPRYLPRYHLGIYPPI